VSVENLTPYERDELKTRFQGAQPFPHLVLNDFLLPAFAKECAAAYPSYEEAKSEGFEFGALNERLKVQVCDAEKFKPPVLALHKALSSPEFLADLEYISGIKSLIADPDLGGGGMHVMGGRGGRLDVHVDFNYIEEKSWHRRLNLLVYLNPGWDAAWGGAVELWDTDIKKCYESVPPLLNRCVIFETSEKSYHGVTPLSAPEGVTRNSFATYYYTAEAPPNWDGMKHSTIFRSRPDEKFRGHVLAPAEQAGRTLRSTADSLKKHLKGLIGK
jgi:hypothetical protein